MSGEGLADLVLQGIAPRHPGLSLGLAGTAASSFPALRSRLSAVPGIGRSATGERAQPALQQRPSPLGESDEAAVGVNGVVKIASQHGIVVFSQRRRLSPQPRAGGKPLRQRGTVRVGQQQGGKRWEFGLLRYALRIQSLGQLPSKVALQRDHLRHRSVDADCHAGPARRVAGDDERSERLVNQGVVGLVHDGHVEVLLHPFPRRRLEVVAQEVETQLAHGPVDDATPVDVAALGLLHVSRNRARAEAQGAVDRLQQRGVPLRQVVVGSYDVDATAQDSVKRGGEGDGNGLSFARVHLHHLSPEQVNPGQQLLVGGPESQTAIRIGSTSRLVEPGGQQDAARLPVPPLPGHIRHRFCDDLFVPAEAVSLDRIVKQPPHAQPPVNGLGDDGETFGQQVLCRLARPRGIAGARQPDASRRRSSMRSRGPGCRPAGGQGMLGSVSWGQFIPRPVWGAYSRRIHPHPNPPPEGEGVSFACGVCAMIPWGSGIGGDVMELIQAIVWWSSVVVAGAGFGFSCWYLGFVHRQDAP